LFDFDFDVNYFLNFRCNELFNGLSSFVTRIWLVNSDYVLNFCYRILNILIHQAWTNLKEYAEGTSINVVTTSIVIVMLFICTTVVQSSQNPWPPPPCNFVYGWILVTKIKLVNILVNQLYFLWAFLMLLDIEYLIRTQKNFVTPVLLLRSVIYRQSLS
jgi:hypothetical protein